MANIHSDNERMLSLVSFYMNYTADLIDGDMIDNVSDGDASMRDYAYSAIMATACKLDFDTDEDDQRMFDRYFVPMVKMQHCEKYANDPYLLEIEFPQKKLGIWEFRRGKYKPYEAFVYDDPDVLFNGRIIPKIGYFEKEFEFPCVTEDGREWMTVTPNEINTMRSAVRRAKGRVLTFGLGLGYYAYSAARKAEVESVTVVERDESIIELFESELLPRMSCRDKINIIHADAFEFCTAHDPNDRYDYVFTDIWHDPSDGLELYHKMKLHETYFPGSEFGYWIEKTLKLYSPN